MSKLTFYNKPPPLELAPIGFNLIQRKGWNESIFEWAPREGKKKQHYVVKYDWNTYIFAIKKIQREWKMLNNVDIEVDRLHGLLSFPAYCKF